MTALDDPSHMISQNLQQAIDDLRRDIVKVEMWADALSGFAQPVAEYEVASAHLLKQNEKR